MKKLLKKIDVRLFSIVAALALFTSMNVNAGQWHHWHHHCSTVGAPLDSGLLAVLLGAGALFFVTRNRIKQKEQ